MKTTIRKKIWTNFAALAVILSIVVGGCKKKDDDPEPTPTPDPLSKTYTLKTKDVGGISGTVNFKEASSGSSSTIVTISLVGVSSGTHPAHIHDSTAVEGGDVHFPLTDVDASGKSTSTLSQSFSTLTNFDGYINVHLDGGAGIGTIIAQGDIGGNELTGTSKTYNIDTVGTYGVTGTAKLEKRKNNSTLLTVTLNPAPLPIAGAPYTVALHVGEYYNSPGPITVSLADIDATTGKSVTNVRKYTNGNPITYDNLIGFTGYFQVIDAMGVTVCQGKITH